MAAGRAACATAGDVMRVASATSAALWMSARMWGRGWWTAVWRLHPDTPWSRTVDSDRAVQIPRLAALARDDWSLSSRAQSRDLFFPQCSIRDARVSHLAGAARRAHPRPQPTLDYPTMSRLASTAMGLTLLAACATPHASHSPTTAPSPAVASSTVSAVGLAPADRIRVAEAFR